MREYDDYGEYRDDHIRLYTPVLQRVIILTAVIIAVPVLMWTVTTFVRSYVARPKVPVLQHVAASESPPRAPVASPAPSIPAQLPPDQTAAAPPRGDTVLPLSDTRRTPGPDIKKGPPVAPSGDATATAPAVQGANAPPPSQGRPAQGSEPAPGVSPAGAAANSVAPAVAAASPAPTPPRPAENTAVAAAPASSDRGFAWPNPNSTSPPGFGPPAAASTPPPLLRTATAGVLPPGEPLRGPIPLPRQRPTVYALAAMASSGGPAPLPRSRPSEAPAEATPPLSSNAPYHYEPGLQQSGN
jgi:hypothetical protein